MRSPSAYRAPSIHSKCFVYASEYKTIKSTPTQHSHEHTYGVQNTCPQLNELKLFLFSRHNGQSSTFSVFLLAALPRPLIPKFPSSLSFPFPFLLECLYRSDTSSVGNSESKSILVGVGLSSPMARPRINADLRRTLLLLRPLSYG